MQNVLCNAAEQLPLKTMALLIAYYRADGQNWPFPFKPVLGVVK